MPMPPKGAVRSRTRKQFTQIVPARAARPKRSAFRSEVEGVVAALAPDTADADAAKGRREITNEKTVHPDCSRSRRETETIRLSLVRRKNHRRESVLRRVGEFDRFRFTVKGLKGQDRTEDFTLDDLGAVVSRRNQRGFEPEPVVLQPLAAVDERVPRLERTLHEPFDAREVVGVNEWRNGGVVVTAVPEHVLLRQVRQAL